MTNRISALSTILRSPMRILGLVLVLVFTAEVAVMLVLPHVTPAMLSEPVEAIVDAILLTLVCAPVLWLVIIGPLRRIAIQEHQRSETIVANAGESILTFGRDGTVLSCNRAATEMFDINAETLIGRSITSLVPALPDIPDQLPSEFRLDGVRSDGEQFPLQISVSEYPSESQQTRIAIVRDLTDSQKSENERILMARKTEALRAQQMTTLAQLATGVAHEIRNPLTSIKMLIQVNRAKFADEGLPTDDLELVEQEIRRMERSVNSLLDYARPETSEFKRFAIQEAVRRTVQLIDGRCRNQNVELVVTAPDAAVPVEGDAAQIQQLLLNLGLNALDAMPTGGTLNLIVSEVDDQVVVSVCDSGTGISSNVLEKLFTPFVTNKTNGIGLGLGICRRIADAHQGKLTGTNQASGGAKFQLTLPSVTEHSAPNQSKPDYDPLGHSQEPPCKAC
ncbi:sensor histidine kinase [Rubripirellula reticaptiva]|nr:ATP-binding protein [Rubripirellula reticaptiva]